MIKEQLEQLIMECRIEVSINASREDGVEAFLINMEIIEKAKELIALINKLNGTV